MAYGGTNNEGEEIVKRVRDNIRLPFNLIFALKQSGDIGYVMLGSLPIRKHGISQGGYPKYGFMDENLWQGQVP